VGLRGTSRVELGERERGGRIRGDEGVKLHALGLELAAQAGAEAVRRDAPEVGDGLLEAPDGAGDVVRPAARVPGEAAVASED
jgi:hypothetical protein